MSGKTLFRFERKMSREDVADYLDMIATKLRENQKIKLTSREKTVELDPSDQIELEIDAEEDRDGEVSLEIELEWYPGAKHDGLSIE